MIDRIKGLLGIQSYNICFLSSFSVQINDFFQHPVVVINLTTWDVPCLSITNILPRTLLIRIAIALAHILISQLDNEIGLRFSIFDLS